MKPYDPISDAAATFYTASGPYSPHDYEAGFAGTMTVIDAFAQSRNIPALRIADKVGIKKVIEVARRFGVTSPIPNFLPVAIGAADSDIGGAGGFVFGVSERWDSDYAALHQAGDAGGWDPGRGWGFRGAGGDFGGDCPQDDDAVAGGDFAWDGSYGGCGAAPCAGGQDGHDEQLYGRVVSGVFAFDYVRNVGGIRYAAVVGREGDGGEGPRCRSGLIL